MTRAENSGADAGKRPVALEIFARASLAIALCFFSLGTLRAADKDGEKQKMPTMPANAAQMSMNMFGQMMGANPMFGGQAAQGEKQRGGSSAITLDETRQLLKDEQNVTLRAVGSKIIIDGRVGRPQSRDRIEKLLEVYDNLVNLTEFQLDTDRLAADTELIEKKINETLNEGFVKSAAFAPSQNLDVRIIDKQVVVSGWVNNQRDSEQAMNIAKIYNEKVINNLRVREQMIEVDAIFAKVVVRDGNTLGTSGLQSAVLKVPDVAWTPKFIEGQGTRRFGKLFDQGAFNTNSAGFGFNTDSDGNPTNKLGFFFHINERSQVVLARPHLTAVNGQPARFHAGGEKAYEVATSDRVDVIFKEYGVILTITPEFTTDGKIMLKVELEFSLPDGRDFITFSHKGKAILGKDEAMVLSGMVNEARSRGVDRTPGVSHLPILGFFFGRKGQAADEEELVLLVQPRIPQAAGQCAPFANGSQAESIPARAVRARETTNLQWWESLRAKQSDDKVFRPRKNKRDDCTDGICPAEIESASDFLNVDKSALQILEKVEPNAPGTTLPQKKPDGTGDLKTEVEAIRTQAEVLKPDTKTVAPAQ